MKLWLDPDGDVPMLALIPENDAEVYQLKAFQETLSSHGLGAAVFHTTMYSGKKIRLAPPPKPLHCKVTGNQCGTDTWMVGKECQCETCQEWLRGRRTEG